MVDKVPVLEYVERYRRQLEQSDAAALSRLVDAYRRAYSRLADKADLLLLEIGDSAPTSGQLVRLARYKDLMGQAAEELQGFSSLTRNEIEKAGELGVKLGELHARELVSVTAVGDASMAAGFNKLHTEAVKSLLGFLDPQGPLYERLGLLAPHTAGLVSDAIVEGVALGKNPKVIANSVRDAFGRGLTDALRTVRTVQIYSYREANRASYLANSDVVGGWIWGATLDGKTCGSCWAMHGSIHGLDEVLDDHYSGRCAEVPLVKGFASPIQETGEQAFEKLSEAEQRQILGPGKHDLYQSGQLDFGKLSVKRDDNVYGTMRSEATLKELSGG